MVVLRLTVHGAKQPQNSPHGWDRKTGNLTLNLTLPLPLTWDRKTGAHTRFLILTVTPCLPYISLYLRLYLAYISASGRHARVLRRRLRLRLLGDRHAALDGARLPSNPLTLTL